MVLVAGARWAARGKDAGSADSGVLSARLRTQHRGDPARQPRHSHYFARPSYSYAEAGKPDTGGEAGAASVAGASTARSTASCSSIPSRASAS